MSRSCSGASRLPGPCICIPPPCSERSTALNTVKSTLCPSSAATLFNIYHTLSTTLYHRSRNPTIRGHTTMFKHSLNPRAPSFEPMASDSESREHTKMVSRNLDPRAPSFEPMASNNKSQIAAMYVTAHVEGLQPLTLTNIV
jgi:hypothetical protein